MAYHSNFMVPEYPLQPLGQFLRYDFDELATPMRFSNLYFLFGSHKVYQHQAATVNSMSFLEASQLYSEWSINSSRSALKGLIVLSH